LAPDPGARPLKVLESLSNHGLFVLLLTVLALYLFTRDRIPLEATSLAIIVILVLAFHVSPWRPGGELLAPAQFLTGFGNEALITVCALMILGKALEVTGALQPLAASLAQAWLKYPRIAPLVTLVLAAALSAFVNNTPVVVMLLPMLISVAVRTRVPPSGILMPMGLGTIVGGMATTIGTSTNLLVVSIAEEMGLPPFGLFDFSIPVLIVGSAGILYLWLVAPRLVPDRKPPMTDTTPRVFNAVLTISEDSAACGKTFAEVRALTEKEMRVDEIQRGEGLLVAKLPSVKILAGDRLAVRDTPERLKLFEAQLGATLHDASGEGEPGSTPTKPREEQQMAEVVVTQGSMLHRRTLASTRFAQRFRLLPLAIHRAREPGAEEIRGNIGQAALRAGDILLVQGNRSNIRDLKRSGSALVLDGTTELPRTHRAKRAIAIMVLVIAAAAFQLAPISVCAITGVGLMLLTGCLNWQDAAGALSTPVIMIIVASLALGLALTSTGGAQFIAENYVNLVRDLPVPVILSGLMLVMTVLTNVVSNNAAGVIGTPIAIQIAQQIGVSPEPFVLAIIFGANMSFATPFGYQTNLLLLAAGGYKFSDFIRVGIPLTLIMWLGFSVLLPVMYNL
jgi:di/tricarboxylate transporter